jgi:hypothetical protein
MHLRGWVSYSVRGCYPIVISARLLFCVLFSVLYLFDTKLLSVLFTLPSMPVYCILIGTSFILSSSSIVIISYSFLLLSLGYAKWRKAASLVVYSNIFDYG